MNIFHLIRRENGPTSPIYLFKLEWDNPLLILTNFPINSQSFLKCNIATFLTKKKEKNWGKKKTWKINWLQYQQSKHLQCKVKKYNEHYTQLTLFFTIISLKYCNIVRCLNFQRWLNFGRFRFRKATEEALRIQENQSLLEAMNEKAKGKHRFISLIMCHLILYCYCRKLQYFKWITDKVTIYPCLPMRV